MVERTGAATRPATARLSAVCAVLFGLFLMHGAPSAAAGGCHGFMTGAMASGPAVAVATPARTTGADTAPVAVGEHTPRLLAAGLDGTLCVSTPAQQSVPLGAAGLPALVVLRSWALTGRPVAAGVMSRRGPPGSGRSLLLRVCVART